MGSSTTHRLRRISKACACAAVSILILTGAAEVGAGTFQARIVHGETTSAYPATGTLLIYDDPAATSLAGLCSGVLIGCGSFLTAAHCVCPESADTAARCKAAGLTDPRYIRVFLQNAGLSRVAAVAIAPTFEFGVGGDVALLTLAEPVTGITPAAINTLARPVVGSKGIIVGFGVTQSGRRSLDDSGIKRQGDVLTATCPSDIPDTTHICWAFDGSESNACSGDSGGPLFVDFGSGPLVSGVTSGGYSNTCLAPDASFDSDVFVNRDWITTTAGADLGAQSCGLPAVGSSSVVSETSEGQVSATTQTANLQFDVPAGTTELRITLNGQLGSGSGFSSTANDFDLFVRAGLAPTATEYDCADTGPTPFGACTLAMPKAGAWNATVVRAAGQGSFQVTATAFGGALASACPGDCDGDGVVTIDELSLAGDLARDPGLGSCPNLDTDHDGSISIAEYSQALASALRGCPNL